MPFVSPIALFRQARRQQLRIGAYLPALRIPKPRRRNRNAYGLKFSATPLGSGKSSSVFRAPRQSRMSCSSRRGSVITPSGNFPPWKMLFRTVRTLNSTSPIAEPEVPWRSTHRITPLSKTCFFGGCRRKYWQPPSTGVRTAASNFATSLAKVSQSAEPWLASPRAYPDFLSANSNRANVAINSSVKSLGTWSKSRIEVAISEFLPYRNWAHCNVSQVRRSVSANEKAQVRKLVFVKKNSQTSSITPETLQLFLDTAE